MTTEIDFLYLNERDMIAAGVTEIAECIDVMEETFVLLRDGDFKMAGANGNSHGAMVTFPEHPVFPGMPADGPDRRFMAMPAYLGGRFGTTGVKWYGSNAENRTKGLPRSIHLFTLNDTDTGAPLAVMSANLLSAYRTGAVPGVGVKHLAREDAKTVSVIGPGVMAKTAVEGVLALRPSIDTLTVKGRGRAAIDDFVSYVQKKYPQVTNIDVVDTEQEAVRDADVVIVAVTTGAGGSSTFPHFDEAWIKPGALFLCPAAAHFDDDFIVNRARTIVDHPGLYEAWKEEYGTDAYEILGIVGTHFYDLVNADLLDLEKIEQIADIAQAEGPKRRSDDEIIIYSVGGMPVEDVAWGTTIYRNAIERGIGVSLNLWDKPALA
ncbi:tyramine oxidase subunit B [Pseudoclavibacter sp. CFCC 11306]|uniref:tyramine oxidase subunit B n=1 Tax=Pseudoclavibacter sp. CFCC 11306 TaxID=1564493 RepID=UPI0013015508|nr:tyramine oxidase subunit B [Pseudoclavibacter sp. CFCC 11306]KAB1657400.1 ornithine cyclodeaminase [Pseudoclavibacter sp. CFCC 11306]